jgi:quinol monooxygenase YgiN
MGRIVIACYRPKPQQQDALRALMQEHVATLREIGLVTDRAPITMEAADGTFIEVFEWKSQEAIQAAHGHPVVLRMWEEYGKVCDYVPVAHVPEASEMFANFTPFDVKLPVEGVPGGEES